MQNTQKSIFNLSEVIQNIQVFSLHEVLNSIQKTLATRYQGAYWMKAEMNKLNFYSHSGHCYPDLVEKSDGKIVAQARAIIWKADFQIINKKFKHTLNGPLKDGINILFLAKITFTPTYGLGLQILDIDPSYSLGVLEREKQETIARLEKEGIFRKNKCLPLPLLPQRIAVISVETSKGYADFLKILNQNQAGYKFFQELFPARLQGDFAVMDIVRQLQKIKKVSDFFDVVVIIRGGGGDVGLSAYNHYNIAKEIACFPIPVLTGIGHATNETISELVAFQNTITPTGCAQFLLEQFEQFDSSLHKFQQKLNHLVTLHLNRKREQTDFILQLFQKSTLRLLRSHAAILIQKSNSFQKSTEQLSNLNEQALNHTEKSIFEQTTEYLQEKRKTLDNLSKNIELVNPENVLRRGFSITKFNGKSIRPESKLPEVGYEIETQLLQGKLISKIIQKTEKETNNDRE